MLVNRFLMFCWAGKQQRIALSVYVSVELLPDLNDGKETLEDILVFHVEGGADSFVWHTLMVVFVC